MTPPSWIALDAWFVAATLRRQRLTTEVSQRRAALGRPSQVVRGFPIEKSGDCTLYNETASEKPTSSARAPQIFCASIFAFVHSGIAGSDS
jgi:hypothetical protein